MITEIECLEGETGTPYIHLFEEGKRVSVGSNPAFLAYSIESHGGPGPVIYGEVPPTHEILWKRTLELV